LLDFRKEALGRDFASFQVEGDPVLDISNGVGMNPNASFGHRGALHGGDGELVARRRASRSHRPLPRCDD
jgi:hypothetical protein